MNAAEIVIREVQGNGGFQMRQLPAECIGEPRKPAKVHPHREVLALYERSADVFRIRTPTANLGYNLRDRPWGVPFIPVLAIIPVELRQLSEIGIARKRFLDGLAVKDVCVGR